MSKTLDEIRVEIDSIDNQVHDLLMRRASLVSSVAAAKKKEGLQVVQPAREARMVRRLLSRHKGPLPQATVVRIWRELVGSVSLLQTGLSVAVAANEKGTIYWDMAKNYFGSVVPMRKINGNMNTISSVREDESSFAVIPWPELEDAVPWWTHLFDQQGEKISIICALPYGAEKQDETAVRNRALVLSKIDFLPSDDDMTFLGLELSDEVSRARIMDTADRAGLRGSNLYSTPSPHRDKYNLHLLEVQGFLTDESERLSRIADMFGDHIRYCAVLGGYPAMQELERAKVG